jgi:NAD(P)H-nitrite reductase large subunit
MTSESEDDPRICFCMRVHEQELRTAIRAGADTVEKLRDTTRAGTGCGTCRIDLIALLDEERARTRAERPEGERR